MTRKNITSLAIVVVFGLIFQVGFVALDCKDTPADTAVSFARDYYRLSPSMARWMYGASSVACCNSVCSGECAACPETASGHDSINCPRAASGDESATCPKTACCKALARRVNTAVENYLYEADVDAAERGFGKNFARYALFHVETRTEYLDKATALVHLTAHRRIDINPLYTYIGRIFRIGDTQEVEESIRLKLEDDRWRVCEASFLSLKTS